MRKLVVGSFLSLDGVMQGPGGPAEDREGGFEQGGWVVPLINEQFLQIMADLTSRAGALLLGRKTYDTFAASWPLTPADDPIGSVLNSIPKYVASRTLKTAAWNNSAIISDDVAEAVAKLKEQDGGEIHVSGSGELIQTLLKHDLIDEYNLFIFPVLVGSGKRLFGDGTIPRGLKLVNSTTLSNGVTFSTYERVGELETGAYGPEIEQGAS
ncbi:MAG: dihydrofolate reductase family protein [Thermomicrobiales bacterium]